MKNKFIAKTTIACAVFAVLATGTIHAAIVPTFSYSLNLRISNQDSWQPLPHLGATVEYGHAFAQYSDDYSQVVINMYKKEKIGQDYSWIGIYDWIDDPKEVGHALRPVCSFQFDYSEKPEGIKITAKTDYPSASYACKVEGDLIAADTYSLNSTPSLVVVQKR